MNAPFPHYSVFHPGPPRHWLEHEVLPDYVRGCRWFGGKARDPQRFEIAELLRLPETSEAVRLALLRVTYRGGATELYQLPLAVVSGEQAAKLHAEFPGAVVAQLGDGLLCDAIYEFSFRDALVRLISNSAAVPGENGELAGVSGAALPRLLGGSLPLPSRVLKVEQSNSSILYGPGLFVKLVRKLEEGVNPDAEILRFLTERREFPQVPAFGGVLEFRSPGREPRLLALASGVVENRGDAWAFTLAELASFLDRVVRVEAAPTSETFARPNGDSLLRETIGEAFLQRAAQLGRRTGEMHVALASDVADPEFAPEPLNEADLRELAEGTMNSLETVLALARHSAVAPAALTQFFQVVPALRALALGIATESVAAEKTRHHGDFHLGQVLETGTDFVIIDFEGEPARSLAERRRKRSPLRDVAGMLRSFHYAAHCGLRAHRGDPEMLTSWAEQWSRIVGSVFFAAWTEATAGAPFQPRNAVQRDKLLAAFLLEKAIYEVGYELNNRPDWVGIPISGLLSLVKS